MSNYFAAIRGASARVRRLFLPPLSLFAIFLSLFAALAPAANAQVYVGGVQSQIGAPGNPWNGPVGVASDTSGNIYIVEHLSPNYIIKIDAATHATSTFLTTVCGQTLNFAQGMAIDASNKMYIADQGSNRIAAIDIATKACIGTYPISLPFAVAIDSSQNIWATTDFGASSSISKIPAGSASGTTPTIVIPAGTLGSGTGLTFDQAGNLYESDVLGNTVWKFTAPYSTATQSRFLQGASFPLSGGPYGLYFDKQGNLYICLSYANQVVEYLAPNYTTYIQVSPNITGAEGVGADPKGNIFLSAYGGSTITEISASTGDFGQVQVGSSQTLGLNFDVVAGTTIGSFQVVDKGATGLQFTEQSPDTNVNLCPTGNTPYGSTTSCAINVVFTPQYPGQQIGAVEALDGGGNILATANISGTGLAPLAGFSPGTVSVLNVTGVSQNHPARPGLDSLGNLYVPQFLSNIVVKIAPDGVATTVSTSPYTLFYPNAVKLDGAGNIYISDSAYGRVVKVTPAGTASLLDNNTLSYHSSGMAVDAAGDVYICDYTNGRIIEFPQGGPAQVVSITGLTTGLVLPYGLALDGAGNLYIADSSNNRVVQVTNSGAGSVVALGGLTLNSPQDVVVDSSGNLYISDTGNNRIVEVPAPSTGNPPVVLSTGSISLYSPIGVVVAGNGTFYIADFNHNRIVVSAQGTAPTLTFASTDVGATSSDSPKTATLLNLGNEALTIASANFATTTPTSGTSFVAGTGTTCSGSLAANSSCLYAVDFTPAAAGSNVGTLTLNDNTLNVTGSTQTINLSGTGINPITQLAYIVAPAATLSAGGNAGSAIAVVEEDASGTKVVSGSDTITLTVTGPNGYSATYTATATGGVATFNLGATALTAAGGYTYTASVVSSSITSATANETVTAAAPATATVNSGSAQSKTIGGAFGTALSVTVTDTYGNPVSGATVTFSGPASGPSAVLSSATATTNASGVASVTATANGFAGAYAVTASSGAASASFSLTNLKAQPPLTLTTSATPVTAGTSVTYTATTSGVGGTTPTGTVTFYDGTTSLGTGTLNAGVATLAVVEKVAATHPISAAYGGDSNYLTAASSTVNEAVTAGAASQIAVKAGSAQSILIESPFPVALSVTVTDAYGNPVGGATVTFSGPSSGAASSLSALSATTGANGIATVTATANAIAGTYAVTATIQGGVSASFTLTNLPATPSVTVATSATPVFILNNVTYTATVTGLNGLTPTGTVTFYDGTTTLGTATLNSSGVATLSSAPQVVGTHPITVGYAGDHSYQAGTGNTVSEVAQDFTVAVAGNGTSSITILPGSTAVFNLVVTPVNGATFPAQIALTVTGGPSSAPPALGTSIVPSGAGATNFTLTVAVPGEPLANNRERRGALGRTALAFLALPLLGLTGFGRKLRRKLPRGFVAVLLALGSLTAIGGLSGCGFASGYFGQAPATYTYTVTGTAGPLNHSTSVTLTIQ